MHIITKPKCTAFFAQYHSGTSDFNKARVVDELGKTNSFIRVVFATTALSMGVNTRAVAKVIHITPSSSIEAYFQEIGRAGRGGDAAKAVLYFNAEDIGTNRANVNDDMRRYCQSTTCLRSCILTYFGFPEVKQKRCCCICHPKFKETILEAQPIRTIDPELICVLRSALSSVIDDFQVIESKTM